MKAIWNWIGSPSYWKSAAVISAILLTLAAFLKTVDWMFTASMLLGFYFCWVFSDRATKAAHNIKE